MEITKEILKAIRDRAIYVCIAKYDETPDRVIIDDDYTIICEHEYSTWGGGTGIDTYHFEPEDLQVNLDILIAERKQREEQKRIEREIKRKEQEELNKAREKEKRKQMYLSLKKEFELGQEVKNMFEENRNML